MWRIYPKKRLNFSILDVRKFWSFTAIFIFQEVKRKSQDITTLTDNTQDESFTTSTDSVESDEMSRKGPPPAPKPKPSVRNKSVSSPGDSKPLPGEKPTPGTKPAPGAKPTLGEKPAPGTKPTPGAKPSLGEKPTSDVGVSKPPTEKTEVVQMDNEHSTERTEAFQITEITDTFKKSVQTTSSSSENTVSSTSEKLVAENKSKSVIPSTENMVDKQTTDQSRLQKETAVKQDVEQSRNNESAQSESPVMMRKKSSTASSPHDMEHFKGR